MPWPAVFPPRPRPPIVQDRRAPTCWGEALLPSGTSLPFYCPDWKYTITDKIGSGSFGAAMKLQDVHHGECVGKVDWTRELPIRSHSGRASPLFSARAAHCCEELAPLDDVERLFHALLPFFGHSPVVSSVDFGAARQDGGLERI
ncbi:hypothetical protein M3Y99_00540800 [Aphelenchoides fujianensis]|nr:hypothetical protein M3Y99_00540800 [Aphelenchoides fujianensis]